MSEWNEPPMEEPPGAASMQGFVKTRAENNQHYLSQYQDWPWFSILHWLDEELEKLIPGYNISQIKMKFGGLRFYIDYPTIIPVKPEWPAFDSPEKIRAMVESRIAYAEAYVDGYQAALKRLEDEKNSRDDS